MAIFLAGTKLSRMGIDIERSMHSTVADRATASVSTTSKSSASSLTGVPPPVRATALWTVLDRCNVSGSPGS